MTPNLTGFLLGLANGLREVELVHGTWLKQSGMVPSTCLMSLALPASLSPQDRPGATGIEHIFH